MGPGEQTASQRVRALEAEYRKTWYRIGICIKAADRSCAENSITRIYAQVGATPPRFLWCDSPLTAQAAIYILGGREDSWRKVLRLMLRPSQRDELDDLRGASRGAWLGDKLQAATKTSVWAALRYILIYKAPPTSSWDDSLRPAGAIPSWSYRNARQALEAAIEDTLRGTLRALKIPYRETSLRGQHEGGWLDGLLYFREVFGIRYPSQISRRLDLWADLARSCMWWWPYRGICIVSERPSEIHISDEGRLHHNAGPSVRFRDGWSIWAIDGVVVDEQIVLHPETQTAQQIRRERNAEIKRIRIERFGWDRYLAEAGAVVIDRRRNDIEATRETLFRTPERESILVCACPSTARVYALAVPQDVETCERAQAWLSSGLSGRVINGA